MKVFSEIHEIRHFSNQAKKQDQSIGLVPTMGALHEGHLGLIRKSKAQNDKTICSIFVNPTQFNNSEDLRNYPRDLNTDLSLLKNLECDVVFHPSQEVMFPSPPIANMSFGYLEEIMEGKYRPGHFKGVGLIVSKLFNIAHPARAYFGEKDLQQLAVVQIMTRDFNMTTDIIPVGIFREPDGLAMSSRNRLLSPEERRKAPDLFQALTKAKNELIAGDSIHSVRKKILEYFQNISPIDLEYFEIVRTEDLKPAKKIHPGEKISLCIAGYLGKVRLIDNISLN